MKYLHLIGAAALAVSTMAQTPPERPQPPRDAREQERGLERQRPGAGLTEEQREKMREVMEKTRDEQRAAAEKMSRVRRELGELTRAEKIDEAAIRAKAKEIGEVEAEMALVRARQFQELKGVIPAEQLERMQPRFGGGPGQAIPERGLRQGPPGFRQGPPGERQVERREGRRDRQE